MLKQDKFIDDKLIPNAKREVCKQNSTFVLRNEKIIKENLFDPSQSSPPNYFLKSLINRLNK